MLLFDYEGLGLAFNFDYTIIEFLYTTLLPGTPYARLGVLFIMLCLELTYPFHVKFTATF